MSGLLSDLNGRLKKEDDMVEELPEETVVEPEVVEEPIAEDTVDKETYEFTDEVVEEVVEETPEEVEAPVEDTEEEPMPIVVSKPEAQPEPEEEEVPEVPAVQVEEEPVTETVTIERELFVKLIEWAGTEIDSAEDAKKLIANVEGLVSENRTLILTDYNEMIDGIIKGRDEVVESATVEPVIKEGQTATNPATGEKLKYTNGKWQPYND